MANIIFDSEQQNNCQFYVRICALHESFSKRRDAAQHRQANTDIKEMKQFK